MREHYRITMRYLVRNTKIGLYLVCFFFFFFIFRTRVRNQKKGTGHTVT